MIFIGGIAILYILSGTTTSIYPRFLAFSGLALILWRANATMVTGGCLVLVIMIWVPELNQYLAPNPTALAAIAFLAKLNQTQPHCYVAVNLSVQLFERIDMLKTLQSLLEIHHANPKKLHVELTESVFIEDFALVSNTLHQLRELGIQVSLDDFGTGFSSLSMLHKLPIDIVKVDRSFVLELGRNSESRRIAESVMLLAKTLNKKVIVEGIENQEQIEFSESFECDGLQGFYFHKPLPASSIFENSSPT